MSLRATLKEVRLPWLSSLASQNGATGGMTPNLQQVQFDEVYLHDSAGCSSPRNSPRLRQVGVTAATVNASDAVWQQRLARKSSKDRSLQPRRPNSTGSTCVRPRVWPENEECALAGEAQPHRLWRLPLRASGRDELKVGYVGGLQRQLQCSGLRHLHQHV